MFYAVTTFLSFYALLVKNYHLTLLKIVFHLVNIKNRIKLSAKIENFT